MGAKKYLFQKNLGFYSSGRMAWTDEGCMTITIQLDEKFICEICDIVLEGEAIEVTESNAFKISVVRGLFGIQGDPFFEGSACRLEQKLKAALAPNKDIE